MYDPVTISQQIENAQYCIKHQWICIHMYGYSGLDMVETISNTPGGLSC